MEDQVWNHALLTASSSKYNHSANRSTWYDMYNDYDEEVDVDHDLEADYTCPFCFEDFDIVLLYSHVQEVHPLEAKKGVCPICGMLVGIGLVDHIALEHEYIDTSETRDSNGGSESNSTISISRKEWDDRSLKSLLEIPTSLVFSSNAAADTLLTSFIGNYPRPADVQSTPPSCSDDTCQEEEPLNENTLEMAMEHLSVNDEHKEEKAQRCEFVQSLLLSAMIDDNF